VYAAGTSLSIEKDISAEPNKTVDVPIKFTNNSGKDVAGGQFDIRFGTDLTYDSITWDAISNWGAKGAAVQPDGDLRILLGDGLSEPLANGFSGTLVTVTFNVGDVKDVTVDITFDETTDPLVITFSDVTDEKPDTTPGSVKVEEANVAPVATDDTASVAKGGTIAIDVVENDTDENGDTLTVEDVTDPQHGTVDWSNTTGIITYTHGGEDATSDSFTYKAYDGTDKSAETATVSITIEHPPVAVNDTAVVTKGHTVEIKVLENDTDANGDDLTAVKLSNPKYGSVKLSDDKKTFTYASDGNSGATKDTFTYRAKDSITNSNVATVTVTVKNTPPVANDDSAMVKRGFPVDISVLDNDVEADSIYDTISLVESSIVSPTHGSLTIHSNGTITYMHDQSTNMSDSFKYQVTDGIDQSNQATVLITVTNTVPVASNDTAVVTKGMSVNVNVLANDQDPDIYDTLTTVKISDPAHGTVEKQADNSFTYTHNGDDATEDTFSYQANDGITSSDTATVTISITDIETGTVPTAVDDSITVLKNSSQGLEVLSNDKDGDVIAAGTLSIVKSSVTNPTHGTLEVGNRVITYTNKISLDDYGMTEVVSDSFTYKITNGSEESNEASVMLQINPRKIYLPLISQ
jgi:hypothetical protein